MAIITTGNNFGATDAVTNTKLNNIANAATFDDPADETSLEKSTSGSDSGKLRIKDAGVTTAKLATSSSKTTGVTFAKMQHISTAKVLGRLSASEGDVEEAFDFKDEDNMASNSATALASQQSIKAYVDSIRPNIVAATKNTTETISFSSENETKDVAGLEITITPRLASSTFIISGYVSAGFFDTSRDFGGIVKYKVNSGSYTTHNLPTSVGSRIATHFKMLQTADDETDIMPFAFTIPFSGLSYSVGDTLTFKLTVTNLNATNDLYINRSQSDTNNNDHSRSISTIVVQEV